MWEAGTCRHRHSARVAQEVMMTRMMMTRMIMTRMMIMHFGNDDGDDDDVA